MSQAGLDRFAEQAHAFSEWHRKAEEDGKVLALGAGTAAAAAAVSAVKAKADDYFARCRLAAFDPRAQSALNREEKEFLALAAKELTVASPDIAALPLARIEADRPLPFDGRANPAWETAILRLRDDAVRPLLGEKSALTEEEWREMQARLAPWFAWEKERPATQVERLGLARVREILEGRALAGIADLIARDRAEEAKANAITDVERLVRFNRDLHSLCTNFVNFKDFYDGAEPAIFQAGRLYLDQRSCDLCLHVADAGRHAGMAGLAGAFLAYCDCVRDGGREKMQIVAAFTDGDSDNLMVGRNGIFYDRQGRDWDATITMIVDNPISMRQAFWLPYKKLVRMIESQVAKRAASAEAASHERLEKAADAVASVDRRPAPPPPPKRIDVGTVAAIGVAVTGAVSALTLILGYVFQLRPSRLPLVVLGLMFLISGPSLLIAWLKLRRRNLGPILDANGWAVNSPAKINVPFGATLTSLAKLPPGARRDLRDPFAEKRSSWPAIVVLALLLWIAYSLLDHRGLIHKWTDGWIGTKVEQSVIEVE